MTKKLQNLVQQAKNTFLRRSKTEKSLFDSVSFDNLVALTNDLTLADVNLPARLCARNGQIPGSVDYLPILVDDNVTIGVFVMEESAKIPIHDHPGMNGLLKVLRGELEITTYNFNNSKHINRQPKKEFYYSTPLEVTKNEAVRVTSCDPCSKLSPDVNNIHEVVCTNGPAAFLDILAPPYDDDENPIGPRTCHYFKESRDKVTNKIQLVQISVTEAWS